METHPYGDARLKQRQGEKEGEPSELIPPSQALKYMAAVVQHPELYRSYAITYVMFFKNNIATVTRLPS